MKFEEKTKLLNTKYERLAKQMDDTQDSLIYEDCKRVMAELHAEIDMMIRTAHL